MTEQIKQIQKINLKRKIKKIKEMELKLQKKLLKQNK